MRIKNAQINIIQGDITEQNVDAIVNAANNELWLGSGVAGAIKAKGGADIETEAISLGPIAIGSAVATKAGMLKAKYVIHAATMGRDGVTDQDKIRAAARSALHCANELAIESVSFPALGCGVGGFSVTGCAKIITQELFTFFRKYERTLREVNFILYDDAAFDEFNKAMTGYIKHVQETLGPGPYVTCDIIIELPEGIVLIERSNPPYGWALPGGFVDYGESLEVAAAREAKEETNLDLENIRQLHTYSDPTRDARFHTISTVFVAKGIGKPQFGDDAKGLKIVPYNELTKLKYAFDHNKVIEDYLATRNR